jgi:hypothetical protein
MEKLEINTVQCNIYINTEIVPEYQILLSDVPLTDYIFLLNTLSYTDHFIDVYTSDL